MYNPKEAIEDSHALNLAILFFAGLLVIVTLIFHHDGALKYWLLSAFGETAPGTVVEVLPAPEDAAGVNQRALESPRNYLKNLDDWISGDRLRISYFVEDNPHFLTFTLPKDADGMEAEPTLPVSYLPANPDIAYPADFLSSLAFDSKATIAALIAGAVLVFLGFWSAKSWSRFRRTMRRY